MKGLRWFSLNSIEKDLPQQFRDKTRIKVLVQAFDEEIAELEKAMRSLTTERMISSAIGKQLDMIGSIVNLSRTEAMAFYGVEATDDVYRTMLKYKIIANTNRCTVSELYDACKLLYDAQVISYHESRAAPASFALSVGANISTQTIALLNSKGLKIKPAGVRCNMSYYSMDFFGFKDLNEYALGFGAGKFAQDIVQQEI